VTGNRAPPRLRVGETGHDRSGAERAGDRIVPNRSRRRQRSAPRWNPLSAVSLAVASSGLALFLVLLATREQGFFPVIDHANLAFHEAGHVILRFLGPTASLYGGTLGQLAMPAVAAGAFWRRSDPLGFALAGVWLFENFLNIARYVGDARAQALPLVGGGVHDWALILSRWGALSSDTTLAGLLSVLGWVGMSSCWLWLFWRWLGEPR
jgi:hypothetical protein